MDVLSSFLGEIDPQGSVRLECERRARALAVAEVFRDRAAAIIVRAFAGADARGVRGWLWAWRQSYAQARAERRRLSVYRARLARLPATQFSDAGLARFIFGHAALGEPSVRAPQPDALSPVIELWEALDRLIAECHRQRMQPCLTLTVAQHVRGRLYPGMREGTPR